MERRSGGRDIVICCKRGCAEFRPVLYLARIEGAKSTLKVTIAPGVTCEVQLAQRYTLFLILVAGAWNKDEAEDDVESQRGFRTRAELGEWVKNPKAKKPVCETTVGQYVREIRSLVKAAIENALESVRLPKGCEPRIPDLIETGRKIGYRMGASGLEILKHHTTIPSTT